LLDTSLEKYDYEQAAKQAMDLTSAKTEVAKLALTGSSYLLRVDSNAHSYVLVGKGNSAYLLQSNVADSMNAFTLEQWMSSPRSSAVLDVGGHLDSLETIGTA